MKLFSKWCLLSLTLFLTSLPSWAFQLGKVTSASTNLVSNPIPNASVVETLKQGDLVSIGDQPQEGFFRARVRSGKLGWISANDLSVSALPAPKPRAAVAKPTVPDQAATEENAKAETYQANEDESPSESKSAKMNTGFDKKGTVKVLGGVTLISSSTLSTNTLMALNPAVEFDYKFAKKLQGIFRVDYLSYSTSTTILNTTLSWSVKSIPVNVGLALVPLDTQSASIELGVMGGLGVGTGLTLNKISVSETTPTFAAKVDALVHLTKSFSAVIDVGYRYLKGSKTIASIDLSGPFAMIGVGLHF